MIAIADLEFHFAHSDFRLAVPSLQVAPSERVAIIGPSGSGKTTLLHLIAGIWPPARGTIRVQNHDLFTLGDAARRVFRVARIGLVFQNFELVSYLDVRDNILLPCRLNPAFPLTPERVLRAEQLARETGIEHRLRSFPHRLSQGELQRAALCRALLPDPPLLLADEPTGHLDPSAKQRVIDLIFKQVERSGATLLMVTHDPEIAARFPRVLNCRDFAGRDPMKNIVFLALRYLRFNKIKTAIMVFSIAVAVFLPLAVNLLVRDYQRDLVARAAATPLVAGAPGSRLDLVLHALYFRGKPARDLTMGDVAAINQSGLALGIPILAKHSARGFPIVGTSLEYFDFRGLRVAAGEGLARVGDCVVGAAVAGKLNLHPGDKLMSDPENVFDLAGSYPINMHVTGILAPTGAADDGAIFTDYKTEWIILGIMHGHQDVAKAAPNLLLARDATNITASEAVLPFQEITGDNLILFHTHGDESKFPVTAILVVPRDTKSATILRGRYEDPAATVQLLSPRQVISETLDLVFRVKRFFDAQGLLVGGAMALLLTLIVLLSLRLRRGEMETMFKIGCAGWMVFGMQAAEIVLVVAAGVSLAVLLAWMVARQFSTGYLRGAAASAPPAAVSAKPRVAVVNYPLYYFTRRIVGDSVDIVFPIPREDDPAFWRPDAAGIRQYQQADLILLNGADYEKWRTTGVLPLAKQVVTSASFQDRYMTNGEVITHSHGKEGLHSHGLLDFNTWMDPAQAKLQSEAIRDALIRLVPGAAKQFEANLRSLEKDLDDLDARLRLASAPLGQAPLLASHPVYHYAARRYGWNLKNVHWEPDEIPSEDEWRKFEKLHAEHPGKIMIWEEDPLPAVAQRLRAMGIKPIAFETCASQPEKGDYLTAMAANAARLAAATAK